MAEGINEKITESQLLNCIIKELGKHGPVFRCNAGNVKTDKGDRFQGLPKGFSDILFVNPSDGVACFVEVKTDRGTLSPHQSVFIDRMKSKNARAGVARSIDEAIEICGLTVEDLL
ncbi:MAG: VRR-NUC domain-containing protein [Eubacterium sp.]|jgi:hypothetical protein|nr:VRR-NUC domain-containing protein [Eubacterium sp.]